jgi:RimJ/RimL family protein N-acetyltransferase
MKIEFLYGQDEAVAQFVAQFVQHGRTGFGRCKTIGVIDDDGRLIAGFVYHTYNDAAGVIEMGAAAIDRRFLTRATLRRMFEYPFIECGCQMLITQVHADNEALLDQFARLNFNMTLIPRLFGRDDDGVYCTLTDDQWLDSKFSRRLYRDARKKEAA